METENNAASSGNHVQLIISAKSSGAHGAFKAVGLHRERYEDRFTQALDIAVVEVFNMMVGTPLGEIDGAALPHVADYTSMVGLAGDLCGVLSFRCSNASAALIVSKMLDTEETASAESTRDALGEISNMVAGAFKAHIMDIINQCFLSVPTVVSGKDYQLHPLADGLRIHVSKNFEGASIWVALDLHGI